MKRLARLFSIVAVTLFASLCLSSCEVGIDSILPDKYIMNLTPSFSGKKLHCSFLIQEDIINSADDNGKANPPKYVTVDEQKLGKGNLSVMVERPKGYKFFEMFVFDHKKSGEFDLELNDSIVEVRISGHAEYTVDGKVKYINDVKYFEIPGR